MVNLPDIVDRLRLDIEALHRDYPDLAIDEMALLDTLDGETDLLKVLSKLNRLRGETAFKQQGLDAYLDELKTRWTRLEARENFIRNMIFKLMESAQLKKCELPEVTFSLRNNPPRVVGDADPAMLPDDLVKIVRTISKTKIKEALEAGRTVEGFQLSNSPPSLVVKVK
jgi:hypothetical protein